MPDPFSFMMQMLPYVFLLMIGVFACQFLSEVIQAISHSRENEASDKKELSQEAKIKGVEVLDSRLNLDPDILDKLRRRKIDNTSLSSFDIN